MHRENAAHVILGQEAHVPKYGIGRVVDIQGRNVYVRTYADDIIRWFDVNNVLLIAVRWQEVP